MSERKEKLFQLGDSFLILPGGSGTIEEATEIISWKFLGIHKKKIIIFNFDDYWSPLMNMYKNIPRIKSQDYPIHIIIRIIMTSVYQLIS